MQSKADMCIPGRSHVKFLLLNYNIPEARMPFCKSHKMCPLKVQDNPSNTVT